MPLTFAQAPAAPANNAPAQPQTQTKVKKHHKVKKAKNTGARQNAAPAATPAPASK